MARSRELALLYEKLAQLVRAGVALPEAFGLLCDGLEDLPLRRALLRVRARVNGGGALGQAFAAEQGLFSPLEIALLAAGEANGRLDLCLDELAALFQLRQRTRQKLLSALAYPGFLLLLSLLLPPLGTLYTTGVLAYLRVVAGAAAALLLPPGAVLLSILALRRLRPASFDRALLLLPVVGSILRARARARFCRALSLLFSAGVELAAALELSRQTLGNAHLAAAGALALAPLRRGATLAEALAATSVFPGELERRVAIAERAGALDRTLLHAAQEYEDLAERRQVALLGALPMVLFLFMGLRIAATVIGAYQSRMSEMDKLLVNPDQLGL